MSKIIKGDIFKGTWDVMMHVANCYHVMGGGIAAVIAERFPAVYEADKATTHGESKLGTFSFAEIDDNRRIYNLYAQSGIGNDGNPLNRNLRYDEFFDSLCLSFCEIGFEYANSNKALTIALPYGIGCGLAGGNWEITEKIIDEVEKTIKKRLPNLQLNVDIYKLK